MRPTFRPRKPVRVEPSTARDDHGFDATLGANDWQEVMIASALDALHCGAAMSKPDGRVVHVNARLAAMLQRPPRAIVGERGLAFVTDAEGRPLAETFLADGAFEGEARLLREADEPMPVIVSARVMPESSPLAGYRLATVIDVTEAHRSRKELQEQHDALAELGDMVLKQAVELNEANQTLEDKVRERTRQLAEAHCESLKMLAVACESRDEDTGAHVRRVQAATRRVAERLGFSPAESEDLGRAATLHDVGKIQVPDAVLLKPGRLDDDERRVMERHTVAGETILGRLEYFAPARRIARHHHENFDGSGYPDRLAGEAIPLEARIVHVVDVYDALTHARPYKDAWSPRDAGRLIREGVGGAFDPRVVDAFFADDAIANELASA